MVAIDAQAGLRALIYCRVSYDKRKGRSVAEQEAACRKDCERNGWDIVDVLIDNDRSSSRFAKKTRESWASAKKMLASGDVDVLVTWASTRSQRDMAEFVALRTLCEANEVLIAYEGRVFDMSDYNDRYITGMDALNGERFAGEAQHNIMRAMKANIAEGRPHGIALYGYERLYDSRSGSPIEQVIVPEKARIVREAAERFLMGVPCAQIAKDFNARGIPSPGGSQWRIGTIRKMLVNPGYTGRRVHEGSVVEAQPQWKAIIDDRTHGAIIRRFADPSRRTNRDRTDLKHVLSGIMKCGVPGCPGRLRQRVSGHRNSVYACMAAHHLSRDQHKVEAYVLGEVAIRLEAPDLADRILAEAENPAATVALEEARILRERLGAAVAAHTAGKLDPELLQAASDELKPLIADADRRAREAGETPDTSVLLSVAGDGAQARFDALDVAAQRDVIRALVDITVLPARHRGEAFDPGLIRMKFRFDH